MAASCSRPPSMLALARPELEQRPSCLLRKIEQRKTGLDSTCCLKAVRFFRTPGHQWPSRAPALGNASISPRAASPRKMLRRVLPSTSRAIERRVESVPIALRKARATGGVCRKSQSLWHPAKGTLPVVVQSLHRDGCRFCAGVGRFSGDVLDWRAHRATPIANAPMVPEGTASASLKAWTVRKS